MAPSIPIDVNQGTSPRSPAHPQKQPGFVIVAVTLPVGDITGAQMRVVADLALAYGDGSVRVSVEQDLLFRWVPARDVPEVYRRLGAVGLGLPDAGTVAERSPAVASPRRSSACSPATSEVRALLAGLEALDANHADPSDFVDLGDDAEFKMEVMEGECST